MRESFRDGYTGMKKDMLVNSLPLGIGGSSVENLAMAINIPYAYLPPQARKDLSFIIKNYIRPNVRDRIRQQKEAGILGKEIAAHREGLSPQRISIPDFFQGLQAAYVDKINSHYQIAKFLQAALGSDWGDTQEAFAEAQRLYRKSRKVEPIQLALSSKIKDFIEYYEETILPGRSLSPEGLLLLATPSLMPYPVKSGLDFLRYRLSLGTSSQEEEKERLLKLYFNDDYCQFENFCKEHPNLVPIPADEKGKVEEYMQTIQEDWRVFRGRKLYLLLERQIPYAREVDKLLITDNCLHGYFISKEWFHHDLFLRIYLISKIEHSDFGDIITYLREKARELVFYPDEKLLAPMSP